MFSGHNVIMGVLVREKGRQKGQPQREGPEGATQLALKMEEGARTRGR